MTRILAFAFIALGATAASAQWCPTCPTPAQGCPPGSVCPVPQQQFQQFVPPQVQQPQVSQRTVTRPTMQKTVTRTRTVEKFSYDRVYRHASRQQAREERREERAEPVYFNGTSRWSWPQNESLRDHMRLHGLSDHAANTWNRQQLQRAHDHIHFSSGRGTPDPNDVQRYLK